MGAVPETVEREPVMVIGGYAVNVARLTSVQTKQLDAIAARARVRLRQGRSVSLEVDVEGHTDSTGTEAYNEGLGLRRATGVAQHLQTVLDKGVGERVSYTTTSAGEEKPIAPNTSRESRSRNRRVELRLKWIALSKPARVEPPPQRLRPPPRAVPQAHPVPPEPCLDYMALLTKFGTLLAALGDVEAATGLYWQGEGYPLTLWIKDKRTWARVISEGVTRRITGDTQDLLQERVFGEEVAGKITVITMAAEVFGEIAEDAENERIMKLSRSAEESKEKKRELVCWVIAEDLVARGGSSRESQAKDKAGWFLYLSENWEEIERLQERCDESRGGRENYPSVELPKT
jgi:hypothetical protein